MSVFLSLFPQQHRTLSSCPQQLRKSLKFYCIVFSIKNKIFCIQYAFLYDKNSLLYINLKFSEISIATKCLRLIWRGWRAHANYLHVFYEYIEVNFCKSFCCYDKKTSNLMQICDFPKKSPNFRDLQTCARGVRAKNFAKFFSIKSISEDL